MAQTYALDPKALVQKLSEKIGDSPPEVLDLRATDYEAPLHALIIGINNYQENVPLAAAVPDALEFKSYLTNDLLVPENQITTIINERATRTNIIAAFRELARPDNGIEREDPIVIYYAGHGSEIKPPKDREQNGPLVQCIIPVDTSITNNVVPIPDFTIGTLVHQIYREKGNNITLIFDCCHSGTIRDSGDPSVRFVDKSKLPELPAAADKDVIYDALSGSRDMVDPASLGFEVEGVSSHVLLAACGHGEVAFENGEEGHGYFTSALLKVLRSVKVDSLTYKGCMQRLPPLDTRQPQNPVCEGVNIHRLFFNAKVPGANTSYIAIKPNKSNVFCLQAGLAQGITPGSTFDIYGSDVPGNANPRIGTLEIDKVDPFVSYFKEHALDLSPIAYGTQVGYGPEQALDIYVTPEFIETAVPSALWAQGFSAGAGQLVLRPVEKDMATVILSVDAQKNATFTLKYQASTEHGVRTLPGPVYQFVPPTAAHVMPILKSYSQWSWHLRRMPGTQPFKGEISLELHKLRTTVGHDVHNPTFEPDGPNLNNEGMVDLVVDPNSLYGIQVVSRSTQYLHIEMLAFSDDLSIDREGTSTPSSSSSSPTTLPPNGMLTIGYGGGGRPPFIFTLNSGIDIQVTWCRLFVSTCPIDLELLRQGTPFGQQATIPRAATMNSSSSRQNPVWDIIDMTIVQRRYPKPHILSSSMSVEEMIALLRQHRCSIITAQLNLEQCDRFPIAQGGSADIYRGCLHNGMRVAIKRSRVHVPNDEEGLAYLRDLAREGYTWSKYRHANILETCGVVQFHGGIALVAQWMENGTVMSYIKKRADVDRLKLCTDIACGLVYLHQMGTTHGDLKGANVLVSGDGVAKLTDFGSTSTIQNTLQFTGGKQKRDYTLRWAAPEILLDEAGITISTDVYSLGMTILEIISGKQPFEYLTTERAVMGALFKGEIPARPQCISPERKQGLELWKFLELCWKANPSERPSAQDAVDVLSSITPEGLLPLPKKNSV